MPDQPKDEFTSGGGPSSGESPGLMGRLLPFGWAAAWVLLFVATHIPKVPNLGLPRDSDKVIHLVSYFTVALLGGRVAVLWGRVCDRAWFTRWVLIYAAYAAFDELTQPFVGRAAEWPDWIADVIGAAAALSIVRLYHGPGRESKDAE